MKEGETIKTQRQKKKGVTQAIAKMWQLDDFTVRSS